MDNFAQFKQQSQQFQVGNQPCTAAPAPRTVASALSRMDSLNERLTEIRNHLGNIADMIGGPRPASGQNAKDRPPSNGVVDRLNDAADASHMNAAEITELLASIHRALG